MFKFFDIAQNHVFLRFSYNVSDLNREVMVLGEVQNFGHRFFGAQKELGQEKLNLGPLNAILVHCQIL